MKKLIAGILVIISLSFTPLSILNPQKADAFGFGGAEIVFDPAAFANLIKQLVELEKIFANAQEILTADVKSILGKYGLGALSPVMDKFLGGTGLKDLLVDEIGGAIGAGGFLEGALSGVLNPEDMVSTLLKQVGLKLPSGLYDNLKDIGYLNTEGILGDIVKGGGGACGVRDDVSYQSIRTVLLRQGLDLNIQEIGEHVASCRFDADAILKDFIAKPTPTLYIPPILSSSCSVWTNGVCTTYRTSFGGGNETFFSNVPTQPSEIIPRIAQIILGIAGGIALLILIMAGYKLMTSKGKPESVQSAKEQITAAIVGLLFILMSFVIFQFIAADLLKVPGICKDANDPRCAKQEFSNPNRKTYEQMVGDAEQAKLRTCTDACENNNTAVSNCVANGDSACRTDSRGYGVCRDELVRTCGQIRNCSNICSGTGTSGGAGGRTQEQKSQCVDICTEQRSFKITQCRDEKRRFCASGLKDFVQCERTEYPKCDAENPDNCQDQCK